MLHGREKAVGSPDVIDVVFGVGMLAARGFETAADRGQEEGCVFFHHGHTQLPDIRANVSSNDVKGGLSKPKDREN